MGSLVLWSLLVASNLGAFKKGPVLQNPTMDGMTFMFELKEETAGELHIYELTGELAHAQDFQVGAGVQKLVVRGLGEGRAYTYHLRVKDEHATGEFSTAHRGSRFSFVVYGDTRSNGRRHLKLVRRLRGEHVDFSLMTGDMINKGSSKREWNEFFAIEREWLMGTPMFPTIGNHDRQGRARRADSFRKFFAIPDDAGESKRYYAFTYGNARFLMLDSNLHGREFRRQTEWMTRQLRNASEDVSVQHIFAVAHHPLYSIALHGGNESVRQEWEPLFKEFGVTAVFSGHDHVYSRAEAGGIHYFVTGGGGAPLYRRKKRSSPIDVEATKSFEAVQHYLRVIVVDEQVRVEAVRLDGTLIETTEWTTVSTKEKVSRAAHTNREMAAGAVQNGERAVNLRSTHGGTTWLFQWGVILCGLATLALLLRRFARFPG